METKELSRTELELVATVSNLETTMRSGLQRISDLKWYENSGSAAEGEIDTIQLAGDHMKKLSEEPETSVPALMRDYILRRKQNTNQTKHGRMVMKEMSTRLENEVSFAEDLHKNLDKTEEKLRMYNLPRRIAGPLGRSCEPLEEYLEKVRAYMDVSWRERAQSLRQKEYKSLMDWIFKLDESEDETRRATSKTMKDVLAEIGTTISNSLIDYFVIVSGSLGKEETIEFHKEVETIIASLSIVENSAVINNFTTLVEFSRRTMTVSKNSAPDLRESGKIKNDSVVEKENEVFHLIVMEILRLEVGFCGPDLPMMFLDEVFLAMGTHLLENVFKDKLSRIVTKIAELKKELYGEKDYRTNFFEQVLYLGVKDLWAQDLNAKIQD